MAESIEELAARHAAQRLTRKSRNAELRRLGIDPDGDEGARYRELFRRACAVTGDLRSAKIAGELAARRPVQAVTLWLPPAEEHAAAVMAGLLDMDRAAYEQRIERVRRELTELGHRVELLRCGVADVWAAMERHGLTNDPAGRAAAYVLIAEGR